MLQEATMPCQEAFELSILSRFLLSFFVVVPISWSVSTQKVLAISMLGLLLPLFHKSTDLRLSSIYNCHFGIFHFMSHFFCIWILSTSYEKLYDVWHESVLLMAVSRFPMSRGEPLSWVCFMVEDLISWSVSMICLLLPLVWIPL